MTQQLEKLADCHWYNSPGFEVCT